LKQGARHGPAAIGADIRPNWREVER